MMKSKTGLLALALLLILPAAGNSQTETAHKTKIKKVILLDRSESGGHVRSRQYLRDALTRLSSQIGFQLQMTDNPADVTQKSLDSAQILILSNGDGDVFQTPDSRKAVEDFVRTNGKGLILVHAAVAFLNNWNYLAEAAVQQYSRNYEPGTRAMIYMDSGTAENLNHGTNNVETKNIFSGLPHTAILGEEYYSLTGNPRANPGVNVLLSLDEASLRNNSFPMGNHPLIWTHKMGNGIVVVHTLGHGRASFMALDGLGGKLLWNEIRYAAKDFMGCMDSSYAEYNPEATVSTLTPGDRAEPCLNKRSVTQAISRHGIRISIMPHCILIVLNDAGKYSIRVTDIHGKSVYGSPASGPGKVDITGLNTDTYNVEVVSPQNEKTVKMVSLR